MIEYVLLSMIAFPIVSMVLMWLQLRQRSAAVQFLTMDVIRTLELMAMYKGVTDERIRGQIAQQVVKAWPTPTPEEKPVPPEDDPVPPGSEPRKGFVLRSVIR